MNDAAPYRALHMMSRAKPTIRRYQTLPSSLYEGSGSCRAPCVLREL